MLSGVQNQNKEMDKNEVALLISQAWKSTTICTKPVFKMSIKCAPQYKYMGL